MRVVWSVQGGALQLIWTELGGPPVVEPATKGFGMTVLQRALGGLLGGTTEISWRPDGLVCEMTLPLGDPHA